MNTEVSLVPDNCNLGDLIGPVDRTAFRRLGQGNGGRLHMMHIAGASTGDELFKFLRLQLAVGARERHQLRAAGKELRRTAFIPVAP